MGVTPGLDPGGSRLRKTLFREQDGLPGQAGQ
jgi:hypothetical protein